MTILKYQEFDNGRKLALFVNNNKIPREDILSINYTARDTFIECYRIFYYGDSEKKEEMPGFWD